MTDGRTWWGAWWGAWCGVGGAGGGVALGEVGVALVRRWGVGRIDLEDNSEDEGEREDEYYCGQCDGCGHSSVCHDASGCCACDCAEYV